MIQSSKKYIFRRPWWRMMAPLLFIAVVWMVPYAWKQVQTTHLIPPQVDVYIIGITKWFNTKDINQQYLSAALIILTILLIIWFFKGLQSLVLTEDGIYRSYVFWRTRSLLWDDVQEIRIDRTITRLEDHRSTTRRLVLKFLPEIRFLWSPRIVIDNATYPEYPFAEAIAVRTGVSHMARRIYRQTIETGKPATFAPIGITVGFGGTIIYWAIATLLVYLAQQNQWWANPLLTHFPILLYISAAALVIWGIDIFFYRQLGCDGKNLLIMRRGFITQTIPIAALDIDSIDIHNNSLKIYARMRKGNRLACIFSTNRFIRNRGTMLCMLRSIYEFLRRQHIEQQKSDTQRIKTVRLEDYAPRFRGEDENGNTDLATGDTPKALPIPVTDVDKVEVENGEFDSSMPDEEVYVEHDENKSDESNNTQSNGLFVTPEDNEQTPEKASQIVEEETQAKEEPIQETPVIPQPATIKHLPQDYQPPIEEELPGLNEELTKDNQESSSTAKGNSKLWQ